MVFLWFSYGSLNLAIFFVISHGSAEAPGAGSGASAGESQPGSRQATHGARRWGKMWLKYVDYISRNGIIQDVYIHI